MDTMIMVVLGLLVAMILTIVAVLVISLRKISDSLDSIAYVLKHNGVNVETRNDIVKVATEVARTKDKIKKLEVSEELLKNKVENLSREVSHTNPLYRSKNLH